MGGEAVGTVGRVGLPERKRKEGSCCYLSEREKKGHVAVYPLLLQNLGCLDALPGGRQLDQYTVTADT